MSYALTSEAGLLLTLKAFANVVIVVLEATSCQPFTLYFHFVVHLQYVQYSCRFLHILCQCL